MYRSGFVFMALVAACAYGSVIMSSRVPQLGGRIVGGEDTTIEQFPYQVSVRIYGYHSCGGSIYSSRVVITAAHCAYDMFDPPAYSVQYGTTVVGGSENVIRVHGIGKNYKYNSDKMQNDIALLYLLSDIPFGANAQPIPLASAAPTPGTPAVVSGWGNLQEGGDSHTILQQVTVEIVQPELCQLQYDGLYEITPDMLCAAVSNGGKDACQGDSGGPLVVNGELVGIVSWGVGCARSDFAGVYTNVIYFKEWIEINGY